MTCPTFATATVRRTGLAGLCCLVLSSCGSGDGDTEPQPSPLEVEVADLFPAGPAATEAIVLTRTPEAAATAGDAAAAETAAFDLTALTLTEAAAGRLRDPRPTLAPELAAFITAIFARAGLPAPPLSAASFSDDGLVAVVDPTTSDTLATPSGFAGIGVPAGALPRRVLLAVARLPDSANFAPTDGPLPTTLDQYPLFFNYSTTPAVTFNADVLLGICQVSDSASAYYPDDATFERLRLAHPNPVAPSTIEVFEYVEVDFLDCDGASVSASRAGRTRRTEAALLARRRAGIGGRVRKFSPFAAVDSAAEPQVPGIGLSTDSASFNAQVGSTSAAPQSIQVTNIGGGLLDGLSVGAITYGPNGTGWLTATLGAATAPAVLTLTPSALASLAPGLYSATVEISATSAPGRSQSIRVALRVFTALGAITGGGAHSCAVAIGGQVYCWGSNTHGQLGSDGPDRTRPTPVTQQGLVFPAVDAGFEFTCAQASTQAYCWGRNSSGQLGNGTTVNSTTPVLVSGQLDVRFFSVGADHACVLTQALREVWCWGNNAFGQLGDGTTTNRSSPVRVVQPAGVTFANVAAGNGHSCATAADGRAFCWGANGNGALGDGTLVNRLTPAPVTLPQGITLSAIAASLHTCAFTTDRLQLWCWGFNFSGQVGDGTGGDGSLTRPLPAFVAQSLGAQIFTPSLGGDHTCSVTVTFALWCWGFNGFGQLGDGTTVNRFSPTLISDPSLQIRHVGAGLFHTCALTTALQAYCWGRNDRGQLGDGTVTNRSVPVPVDF